MAEEDKNIVEEEEILYTNKTDFPPELEKNCTIVGIKTFEDEEEFYRSSDLDNIYQPGKYIEVSYEDGSKNIYKYSGEDGEKAQLLEDGQFVDADTTVGQMEEYVETLRDYTNNGGENDRTASNAERNFGGDIDLSSIDNENPSRYVKLKDGLPDYAALDTDYSLDNIKAEFKAKYGRDMESEFSDYAENYDELHTFAEKYAKLYALKDKADKDQRVPSQSVIKATPNKKDLCLIVKLPETEEYPPFGIVVRDGKVSFSGTDLTKEQLKEAYTFLYNRGISNIEIPDNMHEELKKNLNEAVEEFIDDRSPPANASEAEMNAFIEENTTAATTVGDMKEGFSYKRDIKDNMDAWGRKKCGIPGLTYFHYTVGGWDCWATYGDVNPENPLKDTIVDKNGNIKARFKHKIYTRMHRGKLELAFAIAPGEKMSEDFAEQLAVLAGNAGVDAIDFRSVQIDERDSMTLKEALAKEGIVPIGISLKPEHLNKMIGKYTGEKGVLKSLEYQRKLMIRLKEQEIEKGKWDAEGSFNRKYYDDTKLRLDLAPFRDVYNQVFRPRLELLEHENVSAKEVFANASIAHDIYFAVQDAVKYREGSLHAMLGIMEETVNANPAQDKLNEEIPNKKDTELLNKIKSVIKDFKKDNPDLISDPNAKVTNLSPEHYKRLYKDLLEPYRELAQKEMDTTYKENTSPNTTPETIARTFLSSATERLNAMSDSFRGHFNSPDLKKMEDFDLTMPYYKKITRSKYEPSTGVEELRDINVGNKSKKYKGDNSYANS